MFDKCLKNIYRGFKISCTNILTTNIPFALHEHEIVHKNKVASCQSRTICRCLSPSKLFSKREYVFYFQIISYDSPRGGVSVITEKGETTTSFLLIQQARPADSGQYQCNPSNAQSRSVTVHVLNGKRSLA